MLIQFPGDLLSKYFSPDVRQALASAVVQAYGMVSELDERILVGPESQGIGGHLRKAATAAMVSEVVALRKLPFHPYYVHTGPYDTPHLLLMSDDQRVAFSVNQVRKYGLQPKTAKYRDTLIARNVATAGFDLFNPNGLASIPERGWTYVMLSHGYGGARPSFIGLGIPLSNRRWDRKINILDDATAKLFVPEEVVETRMKPALKRGILKERSEQD